MRLPRPPSISTYAMLFIGAIALLFALVGGVTLDRLSAAREQIHATNAESAREELLHAVAAVLAAARGHAANLADWDETRQQLGNPTYYAYWREHRLLATDLLPGWARDAEVYDAQGAALGRTRLSSLPVKVPEDWQSPVVEQGPEGPELILYVAAPAAPRPPAGPPPGARAPVATVGPEPVGESSTAGWVGLRVDLMAALLGTSRFRYVSDTSLALDLPEGARIAPERLTELLQFRLVDTPETRRLETAMARGLWDLSLLVGGLSLGFYLMLMILLAFPLRWLSRHIDSLRTGGGGLRLRRFNHTLPVAELEKVRVSLNDYQARLDEVHRDLSRKNRELWDLAHMDALTGVHNRRAFDDDWQRTLERIDHASHPESVSFILVDCNHFKSINDSYGHQVGDQVIRLIAHAVSRTLRQGDRLYRLGGDEFAALLVDCPREEAERIARRSAEAAGACYFAALGIGEPVRVSVGMAHVLARRAADLSELHWQADAAMYAAKRPGRSPVAVFASNMAAAPKTLFSSLVAAAVRDAIADGTGIAMHYQPIVELGPHRISHYEALIRIRRGDELIAPYGIMPFVEARSLEADLDRAVIRSVAADLDRGRIPRGTGVAVNLAGPTLLKASLTRDLAPLAAHLGTYDILLEVTETALITHLDLAGEVLERLRRRGFRVALDDFGSGYSSLRYLANMPVDLVKLDITLVRNLMGGTAQSGLVEDIARLILKAGYQIVAEGVESEAVGRRVAALGCRYGQGCLFGWPLAECLPPGQLALPPLRLVGAGGKGGAGGNGAGADGAGASSPAGRGKGEAARPASGTGTGTNGLARFDDGA